MNPEKPPSPKTKTTNKPGGRWPEIQQEILDLLRKPDRIVSIKNRDGRFTFYLASWPNQSYDVDKEVLKKRMCCNIFLQVNCTTWVNINHITDYDWTRGCWKIKLTDGDWYTITEDNKGRFCEKKYEILRIVQVAKELQGKTKLKQNFSPYGQYFCEED